MTIPAGVTTIGYSAFGNCDSLTSINVDENNLYFSSADGVLYDKDKTTLIQYPCGKAGEYSFPASVTGSEFGAFDGCTSLTSIIIPDGMLTIWNSAFSGCYSLTSVTIPDSVTDIKNQAFSGCKALTDVYYGGTLAQAAQISVGTNSNDYLNNAVWHTSDGFSYKKSNFGATGNCNWTLDDDGHLTVFGKGKMADYNNNSPAPWGESITSVTIEDGVTKIGNYGFLLCESLMTLTIPDSVTSIGEHAFRACYSLTSVTIGDSVTTIDTHAFAGCYALNTVIIPDSVTTIGDSAFYKCTSLTEVTIPDSVTTIGDYVFSGCTSLASVTIPDSITTIGYQAFYDCDSLTSVTIPDGVTTIGSLAFSNCDSLASVTIPDSVTTINASAFSSCDSLQDVHYHGTAQDKAAISIAGNNTQLTSATWHYYDNGCDATCNDCTTTRAPIHSYDHTCDTDCNECGAVREIEHTYDHTYDTECNVCGAVREVNCPIAYLGASVSADVSGLAMLFSTDAEGIAVKADTTGQADFTNATYNGYKLLELGVVANNSLDSTTIKGVYLYSPEDDCSSFAFRITDIPANQLDTVITMTPYYIIEIDGVATTVYGEAQSNTYNKAANH